MAMKAKMPAKAAPAPADDDDDDMGADDGNQGTDDQEDEPSDADEGEGDDKDEGSEVIATILKNEDGSFTLIHGDEDEEGEEGEEGEGEESEAGEGEEGGEKEGSYRQTFHTEGELLKGVLDCIRKDQGEDEAGADHDFEGGFAEEKEPTPAAGPAAGAGGMY